MALGCNVVTLGGDRVLSTESAKDLNAKDDEAGIRIIAGTARSMGVEVTD